MVFLFGLNDCAPHPDCVKKVRGHAFNRSKQHDDVKVNMQRRKRVLTEHQKKELGAKWKEGQTIMGIGNSLGMIAGSIQLPFLF
jgi:hypothetical protein